MSTHSDELDREQLRKIAGQLIATLTSPAFIEKLSEARKGAETDGPAFDRMANLLSIEGLREAGVDIPPTFRMSSRTFEDKAAGIRLTSEPDTKTTVDDKEIHPLGICGGAGFGHVCACGGILQR
jgi:hypothetical protein